MPEPEDLTISQFDEVTALLDTDQFPLIRSGVNKRIKKQNMNLGGGGAGVSSFNGRSGSVALQSADLNGLNGSGLTGITGASGGVNNTGSTTIGADSDDNGSGVISFQIGGVEVAQIDNDGVLHGTFEGAGGGGLELLITSYSSLADAVATIGSAPATLVIDTIKTVSSNLTIPATLTLRFVNDGGIQPAANVTVTILGPVIAPPKRIFYNAWRFYSWVDATTVGDTSAGWVTLRTNAMQGEVWANWWGVATANSASDNQKYGRSACLSAPRGSTLKVASGTYNTDSWTIPAQITVDGLGSTFATSNQVFVFRTPWLLTNHNGQNVGRYELDTTIAATPIGAKTIQVANSAGFAVGRRVIVSGGFLSLGGAPEHGPIEYNTIEAVPDGTHVTLQSPLKYDYRTEGLAQGSTNALLLLLWNDTSDVNKEYIHDSHVKNCRIKSTPSAPVTGIIIYDTERCSITDVYFEDIGSVCILPGYCSQLTIARVKGRGTGTYSGGSTGIATAPMVDCRFEDIDLGFSNEVPSGASGGVSRHSNHFIMEVTCRRNIFRNNILGPLRWDTTAGIELTNEPRDNMFIGNTFWGYGSDIDDPIDTRGIRNQGSQPGNVYIGNMFRDIQHGIIESAPNPVIRDNYFYWTVSSGGFRVGVEILATATMQAILGPNSFVNAGREYASVSGGSDFGFAMCSGDADPDTYLNTQPGKGSVFFRSGADTGKGFWVREPTTPGGSTLKWWPRNEFFNAIARQFLAKQTVEAALSAGTGAGSGPNLFGTKNDAAGQIVLQAGTSPAAGGDVFSVTFNVPYASTPLAVLLTPREQNAAELTGTKQVYVNSISTTGFTVKAGSTPLTAGDTYKWQYVVIGTV